MSGAQIIVLPGGGGGYVEYSHHEGPPVAKWLQERGLDASVFHYPLRQRHPIPLEALRAEIRRRRATGASRVGFMGFSAGGHLAGLAALASGATPQQRVDFAVLGYSLTARETETYRPSRIILLGDKATPESRRSTSWTRWSLLRRHRSSSGIRLRTPTCRRNIPISSPPRSRVTASRIRSTCFPMNLTASAWPRALGRPRPGPTWPSGGYLTSSTNRVPSDRTATRLPHHQGSHVQVMAWRPHIIEAQPCQLTQQTVAQGTDVRRDPDIGHQERQGTR
jgi:hypothetical protein